MAIITGQMFGDMSGKVGAIVFSRVKAGKVVRGYVKGIDAKSDEQLKVRARYSLSSARWSIITSSQKSGWRYFADHGFYPKRHKSGSLYTGFQAFLSCNAQLRNCVDSAYVFTVNDYMTGVVCDPFTDSVDDAPINSFSNLIIDDLSNPMSLTINEVNYAESTSILYVKFESVNIVDWGDVIFQNPNTNIPVGFVVYFSNVIPSGHIAPSNPYAYLVFSFPFITTPTGTAGRYFSFTTTIDPVYLGGLKTGFHAGNEFFISVFAVSPQGQTAFIGTLRTTCL
jgi:hypothetical protein